MGTSAMEYLSDFLTVIVVLSSTVHSSVSFNFQETSSNTFEGPQSSMFGYSLGLTETGRTLLVGAPNDKNLYAYIGATLNVSRSGALYICDPQNLQGTCSQAEIDTIAPPVSDGYNFYGPDWSTEFPEYRGASLEHRDGQLLGSTVFVAGSWVGTCAPLYSFCGPFGDFREPVGKCFYGEVDDSSRRSASFQSFSLTELQTRIEMVEKVKVPIKTMIDTSTVLPSFQDDGVNFGFSAVSLSPGNLIAGAPSTAKAYGQAYQASVTAFEVLTDQVPTTKQLKNLVALNSTVLPQIPKPLPDAEKPGSHGYAVVSGTFDSSGEKRVAVSTPWSQDMRGSVAFYNPDAIVESTRRANVHLGVLSGTQTGAYFGASLASIDVNGDGQEDLIISSPLYVDLSRSPESVGRIDVYASLPTSLKPTQTILGQKIKGRFGHSLANIGDLDRDGVHDVAIGDPYGGKDGLGVVYIHFGSRGAGLSAVPSQTIEASSVGSPLVMFGWSIVSADVNVDGYEDLLIGAPGSSKVVMLQGRPVIRVEGTLALSADTLTVVPYCIGEVPVETTSRIDATVCWKYSGINGRAVPGTLGLSAQIDGDNRWNRDGNRPLTLTRGGDYTCTTFVFSLQKDIVDFDTPLSIIAGYQIVSIAGGLNPVVDKMSVQNLNASVHLVTPACVGLSCAPTATTRLSTNSYVVGSAQTIVAAVEFSSGDSILTRPVYSLILPKDVQYRAAKDTGSCRPVQCYSTPASESANSKEHVNCKVGTIMPPHSTARFEIEMVMKDIHPESKTQLNFKPSYSVADENPMTLDPIPIELTYDASAQLSGRAEPSGVIRYDSLDVNDTACGPAFSHTYSITVNGPGRIKALTATISWPLYGISPQGSFSFLTARPSVSSYPGGKGTCYVAAHAYNETCKLSPAEISARLRDLQRSSVGCSANRLCVDIVCTLSNIDPKLVGKIKISVNASINTQATPFTTASRQYIDDVALVSRGEVAITSIPYKLAFDNTTLSQATSASTVFLGSGRPTKTESSITWWWIAVAVCGGVLLLIIIITVLWRCGFFNRNRPLGYESEALLHRAEHVPAKQPAAATEEGCAKLNSV